MASVDDHLALANRTHGSLVCLIMAGPDHTAWIATMAFYKALHVVEAMFAKLGTKRATTHEERDRALKAEKRFQNIYSHYRPLSTASQIARYLSDRSGPGYKSFNDYMTPEKALDELIHHRLHKVEMSALKLMGDTAPHLLRSNELPKKFGAPDASVDTAAT